MTNLIRYDPTEVVRRRLQQPPIVPSSLLQLADDLTRWPDWSASLNRLWGDNLRVDMVETDNAVTITAAVPGIDPERIVIEEQDGWLSIRGEQTRENDGSRRGWHLHERTYRAWRRTLRLPAAVNADSASAEVKDGVLTVKLPKQTGQQPRHKRIKVTLPKLRLPKLGKRKPKVEVITENHS